MGCAIMGTGSTDARLLPFHSTTPGNHPFVHMSSVAPMPAILRAGAPIKMQYSPGIPILAVILSRQPS